MLKFFFLPSGELEMGRGGFEDPMRMVWEVRAIISFLWDANLRLVCKLVYLPACSQTALYSRITGKPQWLCPKAVQSGDSSTSEICLLSRLGWKSRVGGVAIGGRTQMKLICSTQTFSGTKKKFTHTLSQHGKWPSSHWGFCIELRGLGSPCECPACLILYMQSCEPTLGKMQWFQSPVSHMTSWSFKAIYCVMSEFLTLLLNGGTCQEGVQWCRKKSGVLEVLLLLWQEQVPYSAWKQPWDWLGCLLLPAALNSSWDPQFWSLLLPWHQSTIQAPQHGKRPLMDCGLAASSLLPQFLIPGTLNLIMCDFNGSYHQPWCL